MFAQHFDHLRDPRLRDPRRDQGKLHRLDHLLVSTLCAVVAGADGWDDIAAFTRTKDAWLTQRLGLKHGTPSADTVRRVLAQRRVESTSDEITALPGWDEAFLAEVIGF